MPSKIVNQNQKDGMVNCYMSGDTAKVSAARFGLSYSCCIRELKKRGICIRKSRDPIYKKYSLNESVFEKIDTEEKAYWLGFIMADGYVAGKKHFAIRLALADISHVEKFRKFIESNHLIKKINAKIKEKLYSACGLFIGCKKMVSDLSKYGIVPNKTETASYPAGIPSEFERHFWRGYFDGDGCISFSVAKDRTAKNWSISAVGKEQIIIDFEIFIKKHIKTDAVRKKRKNTSVFTFGVCGINLCQPILNVFYKDSLVSLDRKYDLYTKCLSQEIQRRDTNFLTSDFLTKKYQENGNNWEAVAKDIGIHPSTLLKARKKLGFDMEKVGGDSRSILVFDKNRELVGKFNSSDEVSSKFNISKPAIWAICGGRNKKTKNGYVFKYCD
jgi:hypothetical protein